MKIKLWILSIASALLLCGGFVLKNIWDYHSEKNQLTNFIVSIKLPHIIAISVEGSYAIYYGDWEYMKTHGSTEQTLIGSLHLKGDRYSFLPEKCFINLALSECIQKSSDPREKLLIDRYFTNRFFFLTKPKGKYTIQYESKFPRYTALENVEDNETLVRINFDPENTDINSLTPDRVFLIRNMKDAKKLRFHSTISEVEFWSITKHW
ncbi:hypothetical protein QUB70_31810 [Microcoleus sp. A003_D6]|uniref:hypothetical protein n=1 Tax=Microcoleus sp. A003_D6 TaxID=3055266 RepID=UPI002FD3773B